MKYKPLPVGYENFREIIDKECYFVDKTFFIKELIDKKLKVNLFTRPRRFGKTLMLSLLKYFFWDAYGYTGEKEDYRYLFEGLKIMDAGEEYTRHMGQYPVISLTLKSGKQSTFEGSLDLLCTTIGYEFDNHSYVLESEKLTQAEKEKFRGFLNKECDLHEYKNSLDFLCKCLKKVFSKNVIVLLDEYDVPLEGAYHYGFYDEMVDFIRELFGSTLKTNDALEFAVITGCLRISKESIFTGLNNLAINSILGTNYGEYFGFTDDEVKAMCADYGLSHKYEELKSWYNGYYFGDVNVYNPWSTILYMYDHVSNEDYFPVSYWANTSSNSIVRDLIDRADREVKDELEHLIAGGSIEKPVHEDITYDEIYDSMDNLWNFMFFTGYFKKVSERFEGRTRYVTMDIPNQEVLYIFENKVRGWFDKKLKERNADRLFEALTSKNADVLADEIAKMLRISISYYDYKENFYHGFMTGVLYGMEDYVVKSNRESGNGRTDIFLKPVSRRMTAYIFEFKCADSLEALEDKAREALAQINEKHYEEELISDSYKIIVKYGVAFYKKDCFVVVE